MRGIPARDTGCGVGSAKRPRQGDSDAPEKEPTVCFTGTDGKVLTFVKSSYPSAAETDVAAAPSRQPVWNRRFVSTEPVSVSKDVKNVESPQKDDASSYNVSVEKGALTPDIATPVSHPSDGKEPGGPEDYFQKEDEFMFKQEIEKSKVRLNDGRGNELDCLLSPGMSFGTAKGLFKETDEATLQQYLELLNAHLHFAKDQGFIAFLEAIKTIINVRLLGDGNTGEVSEFVVSKIDSILESKGIVELEGYEAEIKKKLNSDAVVDANFWEFTLSKIPLFKVSYQPQAYCLINEYKESGTPDTEMMRRSYIQATVKKEGCEAKLKTDTAYDKFMKSLKLEEDELLVEKDVPYGNSSGIKPRYVVRMTMGFEWNKYNQRHFDVNNPPPKHIQGCKFNIFFNQTGEPTATPKWNLVKDGDSKDTCLIVFKGGQQYSPIAFRIPTREWDTDPSRGFKNFFNNGVLHLYFTFRRLVYRR